MKSSDFHNGTLTALFALIFFCSGMSPGYATTFTPIFTDCLQKTSSWKIRHGEDPFVKETAKMCQYDTDPLSADFMTIHHTSSYREIDWPGYGSLVEWEGSSRSSFGEDQRKSSTDNPLENTLFMTEMFWDHVDMPFGNYEYSSFRIMMEGRL